MQAFNLVVDGITTVDDVVRSVYAPGVDHADEAQKELPVGKRSITSGKDAVGAEAEAAPVDDVPHEPISMGPGSDPPRTSRTGTVSGSANRQGVSGLRDPLPKRTSELGKDVGVRP